MVGVLKLIIRSLKLPQKLLTVLLEEYCLTYKEFGSYLMIFLLSIPIYIYFFAKACLPDFPGLIVQLLGYYTVVCIVYLFLSVRKSIEEKLSLSLLLTISYTGLKNSPPFSHQTAAAAGFLITVAFFLVLYLIIYNRYYNLTVYKDNPAGLVLYAKKYAVLKFNSEFVAGCIKIKDNAKRSSVRKDIDKFYDSIKRELSQSGANKSIAEYSEEKIKKMGLNGSTGVNPQSNFNKGYVTLVEGIKLPVQDFNGGVPVVYISGLDNHITNTLGFARKCKVGIDSNGQNYIYPTTPYLNQHETSLFTDADNIVNRFSESKLKLIDKNQMKKDIGILDKVEGCCNDFLKRIKETFDIINSQRLETEIERSLRQDIEKISGILSIYKLQVEQKESGSSNNLVEFEEYRNTNAGNKRHNNYAGRGNHENNRITRQSNAFIKSRQEIFAEGMDELENLVGLNGVKNEIKEIIEKYRIDKYAKQVGLAPASINNSFVFLGNPGTGKTSVCKILAKLLFGLDLLKNFEVYEVNRSDLLGNSLSETEDKSRRIIDDVVQRGCLLLIENFHQLVNFHDGKEYGGDAVKIITSALDEYKGRIACVVTGYPEEFVRAIKTGGPDLESRFSNYLYFENLRAEELVKIFEANFCGYRYQLNHESRQHLKKGLVRLVDAYPDFYNALGTKKLFEKAVKKQTSRLSGQQEGLSKDKLMQINKNDIEKAIEEFIKEKNRIEEYQVGESV